MSTKGNVLLDARVDNAALQDAHRDNATPMVQHAYPRKGVWSGKNQLGVELPFQLDANHEQTIFKMDEWGFPEVWSIALSVSVPTLIAGQVFDIIGEISFGAGGITQTFEVDWVEGTILSLPMNAINIRARWSNLATFFGIAPPPDVRVSVIAARGGIRHARATKTDIFAAVLGPGQLLVDPFSLALAAIPKFSKSVVFMNGATGSPSDLYSPTTLFQFFTNNAPVGNFDTVSIPGNLIGPTASGKIPIPANSRYWSISNIGLGAANIAGAAVWNLFDE